MTSVLVDGNVLLAIATNDPTWGDLSAGTLERLGDEVVLVINANEADLTGPTCVFETYSPNSRSAFVPRIASR